MSKYLVTYCTMDTSLGANPFWHTCILLSRYDEKSQAVEVVDNWSFYGLPTTASDSMLRTLKIKLGLDVDLSGNMGKLRHEEARFLDLGVGLHGTTFEVTEEKFFELQRKCEKVRDDEDAAIADVTKGLGLKGKDKAHTRIDPLEHLSKHIFELEKAAAKEQNRPSRLQEFSLSFFAPNTCKMVSLGLLRGILTPAQLQRVTGFHHAVSRFSGPMETIHLHSSGTLSRHEKRSGEVVYYRDLANEDVKLHWTIPPQDIEWLSGNNNDLFSIHQEYREDVKAVVRKLQQVEWLFQNAVLPSHEFERRDELIKLIRLHYQEFSKVEPKQDNEAEGGWTDTFKWLLKVPRDHEEDLVTKRLAMAKNLINALYIAMDPDYASLSEEELSEDDSYNDVDAGNGWPSIDNIMLASVLPEHKKEKLCEILGRTYLEPAGKYAGEQRLSMAM